LKLPWPSSLGEVDWCFGFVRLISYGCFRDVVDWL